MIIDSEVQQLQQAVQHSGLEHPGSSSVVERLDGAHRFSSGRDLLYSLGALISKFDPIAKVIDDVSRVSQ